MLYTVVLVAHSYLRWLVLVASIVTLAGAVRGWLGKRAETALDRRVRIAFVGTLDLQLLLGLALYIGLSPVTAAFFADPRAGMKDPQLRFFGMEHLTMMLLGVVMVHVARVRARRMPDDVRRHRATAITTAVWLLLVLTSIPWPGLRWGRPLFR